MIKCKVNKGESAVMASGSTQELAAELSLLIGGIYNVLKDNDPGNADFFRLVVKSCLDDASPVWNCSKKPDVAIVISRPVKEGEV